MASSAHHALVSLPNPVRDLNGVWLCKLHIWRFDISMQVSSPKSRPTECAQIPNYKCTVRLRTKLTIALTTSSDRCTDVLMIGFVRMGLFNCHWVRCFPWYERLGDNSRLSGLTVDLGWYGLFRLLIRRSHQGPRTYPRYEFFIGWMPWYTLELASQ